MDDAEIQEAIEHQKSMLTILRQRLRDRELQEIKFGLEVPPQVTSDLRELRISISAHEAELSRLSTLAAEDTVSLRDSELTIDIAWDRIKRSPISIALVLLVVGILVYGLWFRDRAAPIAEATPTLAITGPLVTPAATAPIAAIPSTPTIPEATPAANPLDAYDLTTHPCLALSAIQPQAPDVDAARKEYDLGKAAMGGDDVAFLPKLPMIISHFAETIAYAPNNEGEMRFDGLYQMSIALAYFERYQSEGKPGYLTGDAFPCALEYLSAANELADQATKDRLLTKNHGQLVVYSQIDPCQGLALLDKVDRTQVPYDAIDFYRGLAFEQLHNWDKAEAAFNLIKNSTSSDGEVDDIKRTQLPEALARVTSHPETPPPTPCPPSP